MRGHTHSQVTALPIVPGMIREELEGAGSYFNGHARWVFCDMIDQEISSRSRIVCQDALFVCIAPCASRLPYEGWILPKARQARFEDVLPAERRALAGTLQSVLRRQDRLLSRPAYHLLVHTAPPHSRHRGGDLSLSPGNDAAMGPMGRI